MSKILAIKGHSTRGKEVIELLEMLGGVNIDNFRGIDIDDVYVIDKYNNICFMDIDAASAAGNHVIFTLDEFYEKYPYNVSDKVNIIEYESEVPITKMSWTGNDIEYCVVTCYGDEWFGSYEIKSWNDYEDMEAKAECKLIVSEDVTKNERMEIDLNEYEYKVENDKLIICKKKPVYPKTIEECYDVLEVPIEERYVEVDNPVFLNKLIISFTELLICRNAYWKIAGEQMGLDKSWKPDYENEALPKYCIFVSKNVIVKNFTYDGSVVLSFPTEEMRDAFYENFKKEIEQCKDLL